MSKKLRVHENGVFWANTDRALMENPCPLLASFASTAGTAGMGGQENEGKQHSEEGTKSTHVTKTHPSHTVQPCSQVLSHC